MSSLTATAWYQDGLRFSCTQCGNCCSGAPGFVFVTAQEVERIAEFIHGARAASRMDHRDDFESTGPTPCGVGSDGAAAWLGNEYLRRVGRRYSLTEDKNSGDCCFLRHREGKRVCGIYPVRPLQCRTWPFWERNLESPQAWAEAARECPGMNRGSRYDFVQIEVRRTAGSSEELPE